MREKLEQSMELNNKPNLRYLDVAKIYLTNSKRFINYTVKTNEFLCFDTETYKGCCKLMCDSKGRYIYNPTFLECLDFLFINSEMNYYRGFWNIDFDISAVLKIWNNVPEIDKLIHGEI
ncbi:unnamed protein product, partial [marine sediment metagenome]